MSHPFDSGYFQEPFLTLVKEYPEADVYPSSQFRIEWGSIFHRGRWDGTARVLVIGQDPAQHEAKRSGKDDLEKRNNITITIPKGVIP